MQSKTLIAIIVIIILVIGGYFLFTQDESPQSPENGEENAEEESLAVPAPGNEDVEEMRVSDDGDVGGAEDDENTEDQIEFEVVYTDQGFSPGEVTVPEGAQVRFINESSELMWVASALHPTHQELPGFDQNQSVGEGGEYEFTFDRTGEWNFHNHVNPSHTGTVIVN